MCVWLEDFLEKLPRNEAPSTEVLGTTEVLGAQEIRTTKEVLGTTKEVLGSPRRS